MANHCPGCKTDLVRREYGAWGVVCGSCSALVLSDGLRFPGATVDMPLVEDLSPLRVGSVGRVNGAEFRVMGRVRVESERGYRNFWSVRGDVDFRWIAQCFGNYALLSEWTGEVPKEELRGLRPLRSVRVGEGDAYSVEMLDTRFRYAWEGQLMSDLPMPMDVEVEAGRPPDGKVLLLIDRAKRVNVLKGRMVEFADLHIENPPALAQWM